MQPTVAQSLLKNVSLGEKKKTPVCYVRTRISRHCNFQMKKSEHFPFSLAAGQRSASVGFELDTPRDLQRCRCKSGTVPPVFRLYIIAYASNVRWATTLLPGMRVKRAVRALQQISRLQKKSGEMDDGQAKPTRHTLLVL